MPSKLLCIGGLKVTPRVKRTTCKKVYVSQGCTLALLFLLANNHYALAAGDDASATTDTDTGTTVTASDANGLLNNDSAPHFVTIDSNSGPITLGTQDTTDAITFISTAGDRVATYTITSSGTANVVTFAGDIESEGNERIILNSTNTSLVFTGDVQAATGTNTLNLGSGSSVLSVTFDTSTNSSNSIAMSVNALSAADNITLNITNTEGTSGNTVTFTEVVGGVSAANAIDTIEIQTSAKAVFTEAVRADLINITTTETTAFDSTATISTLNSSGNISTGSGLFDINGNLNMSGSTLTIGNGDASIAGETIQASAIVLQGGGDISFDGTSEQTVSGEIDGAGVLSVSNSETVTFENALGSSSRLGTINVSSGNAARFNSTVATTDINVGGELHVEDTVDASGTLTLSNTTITLGSNFNSGDTIFSMNDLVTVGTTSISIEDSLADGTYILIDSTTDSSSEINDLSVDDGFFSSLALVTNGNDIDLVVSTRSESDIAADLNISTTQATSLINANQALSSGNDALLADLVASINAGGATARNAAKSIAAQPEILSASAQVNSRLSNQIFQLTSNRLSTVRNDATASLDVASDIQSNDGKIQDSAWMKAFGSYARQSATSDIDGYDASSGGITFGYDKSLQNNTTIGAAFTYANSTINGDGAGKASSRIHSYFGTIYGGYSKGSAFVEGSAGFGINNTDSSRIIDFLGSDTQANADYNSYQYVAAVKAGVDLEYASVSIEPSLGMSFIHLSSDSYTETGAGGLNQRVDPDNLNLLTALAALKVSDRIRTNSGYFMPSLRVGLSYELLGETAAVTSQFTGGGAAFSVEGQDPEQLGANVGAGILLDQGTWSIGADYDLDLKPDYISHSANIKARIRF